jgi:hypothetical protein
MSLEAMARSSVDAHIRYIIATDAAAFLMGVLLLSALFLVPGMISALALWLLVAGLAVGLALHVLLWFFRGIRFLELFDETLTVYRGRNLKSRCVPRLTVSQVTVTRLLGRRTAVLLLISRKKVRIPEDAFPREAFARFLDALFEWAADARGARLQ